MKAEDEVIVAKFAMHLALINLTLQSGVHMAVVQSMIPAALALGRQVMNMEVDGEDFIQVASPIPAGLAALLAEGETVPDLPPDWKD